MKKSFQTSLILLLLVLLLSNNFLGGFSIGIAQQLNENNFTNRETQDKDLLVNEEEVESDIAAQHESTQADSKPVDENNNRNNYENSYSEEEIPIQEESVEESIGEDMLEPPLITPFVGDLNVDIDISPFKDEVDSGKSANYNLVLKTTGSQKEYNNAEIIVDLPINDYTAFNQDLDELKIAGVVPSYNSTDHTLTYQFDQLKTGQTYDVMIKIDTKNGYTPSGTILEAKASFESDERDKVQDEATVTVTSSSAIHINKIFTGEVWNGVEGEWQKINPLPDHITKWLIEVEIPKKDIGQMYLKEGSKIVVTDTLPDGLSYDLSYVWGTESLTTPRETGNQLIWEFDAPSLEEQESAEGSVFTRTIEVWLRADMDTEKTYQNNTVDIEATLINDVSITDESEDSIYIYGANGDSNADGFPLVPPHFAPANGEGQMGASDDFPLEVYDDAWLKFGLGIGALNEGQYHDFKELTYSYHIDENLTLTGITTPGKWRYYPDSVYYPPNVDFDQLEKLEKNPTFDIYANVNGQEKLLIENAESSKYYSRKDLDLNEEDVITNIEYRFTYAPKGLFAAEYGNFDFSVEEGYIGQVENYFTISGFGGDDQEPKEFYYDTRDKNDYSIPPWSYPRKVTIIEKPENAFPVATVGVSLEDHNKGEVVYGPNRMEVTLDNRSTSAYSMKEKLETVVLLPPGVKVSEKAHDEYSNDKGGSFEVIDNYKGTARQLVKFTWNEEYLRYQDSLKAWIDVEIEDINLSSLKFDVYGFSGDKELRVPTVSGDSITDTILQRDDDDLNGDGLTNQPRIKAGNIYTLRGEYNLQTEKFVKGELDDEWNKFGQTVPGGSIEYKLHLTNTTGKDITRMTLIDVLPSVGDLGITDNISRGSKFTPTMNGPISLPSEWKGKVKVFYSEAKTPKRDDLIRHTKYPDTTEKLSNPAEAEEPNWKEESAVENWKKIHSFKIELVDGEEWILGDDMEIIFSMIAPNESEVDHKILDPTLDKAERAACNSFAIATDYGQPVEPRQVCVYMNSNLGAVELLKLGEEDEPLANVSFALYREGEDEPLELLTTNDLGLLQKDELAFGNYYFVEVEGLAGFAKDGSKIPFQITEPGSFDSEGNPIGKVVTEGLTVRNYRLPEITKDVEEEKHIDIDRNREYIYNINLTLPKDIEQYKSIGAWDQLDKRLSFLYGVNENTQPLSSLGEKGWKAILHTGEEEREITNDVKFEFDEKDQLLTWEINDQSFLKTLKAGQWIQISFSAKIRADAELKELEMDSGIPNIAHITFDNDRGQTNEPEDPEEEPPVPPTPPVTVKPGEGGVQIIKVDAENSSKLLSGAVFKLVHAVDDEGLGVKAGDPVQASGTIIKVNGENWTKDKLEDLVTDKDGQITIEGLTPGNYQLIETKAPTYQEDDEEKSYRLLSQPIDLEIKADEEELLELIVKNHKPDWELPETGGIGTVLFYSLGIVMMMGVLVYSRRRRKEE